MPRLDFALAWRRSEFNLDFVSSRGGGVIRADPLTNRTMRLLLAEDGHIFGPTGILATNISE